MKLGIATTVEAVGAERVAGRVDDFVAAAALGAVSSVGDVATPTKAASSARLATAKAPDATVGVIDATGAVAAAAAAAAGRCGCSGAGSGTIGGRTARTASMRRTMSVYTSWPGRKEELRGRAPISFPSTPTTLSPAKSFTPSASAWPPGTRHVISLLALSWMPSPWPSLRTVTDSGAGSGGLLPGARDDLRAEESPVDSLAGEAAIVCKWVGSQHQNGAATSSQEMSVSKSLAAASLGEEVKQLVKKPRPRQ